MRFILEIDGDKEGKRVAAIVEHNVLPLLKQGRTEGNGIGFSWKVEKSDDEREVFLRRQLFTDLLTYMVRNRRWPRYEDIVDSLSWPPAMIDMYLGQLIEQGLVVEKDGQYIHKGAEV